jgi:hypothetical protein
LGNGKLSKSSEKYTDLYIASARNDYFCSKVIEQMGQLAFIKMFLLVSIPTDVNDNRRHIHVFRKGGRHLHSVAKIWIERDGNKDIEIAESLLSAKDNAILVAAIDRHWEFLNEQITRAFNGEKTKVKNLEK